MLKEHSQSISSLAFNYIGSVLASGSFDNTIKLWNVEMRSLIATLKGHQNSILSIAFKNCSPLLASGSSDQTIIL